MPRTALMFPLSILAVYGDTTLGTVCGDALATEKMLIVEVQTHET